MSALSAMPGSFDLDRAHFFQVPRTPSASISASASSSLYLSRETSRKRVRRDGPDSSLWESSGLASPAPLVNTDYRLAGVLETPRILEDYRDSIAELDYRPNRYGYSSWCSREEPEDDYSQVDPSSNSNYFNSNPRKRSYSAMSPAQQSEETTSGWGRSVFNVVGRVLDFCLPGAFRGFYAGGGRGYHISTDSPTSLDLEQSTWQTVPEQDDVFGLTARGATPIPGQFPNDNDHNDRTRDDLRSNWVLVAQEPSSRGSSPTHLSRKVPRKSSAARPPRRSAITPRMGKRPVLSSARPSMARPTTPTHHPTAARPYESPASAEVQRFAAKVRRREREEDASIQRLNDQLKAMIREGREALGARVEIDESMDPDDFE
jgi:hypothetical protein